MTDQIFSPDFENDDSEHFSDFRSSDIGVTDYRRQKSAGRPFIGRFDLTQVEGEISTARPTSEADLMVQSILLAILGVSPGALANMVNDVSDTSCYFRFYNMLQSDPEASDSLVWVKVAKTDSLFQTQLNQGSVFLRLFTRGLIQLMKDLPKRHPLIDAFFETCDGGNELSITPAHRRFILKEFGMVILGQRVDSVQISAPAPWSTQFLLFSAGHIYEACNTIMPKSEMLKWSKYVHTNILNLSKELLQDFPFTPWGEKLFFYYHLMAAELGDEGKKILMGYWEHHAKVQTHSQEVLNSAWRTLLEKLQQNPKRLSVTQIWGRQLRQMEENNDSLGKWITDDRYHGEGIRDISQFVRDLSQLRVNSANSSINFGKLFSSDN